MRYAIIGAGHIGSALAGHFARQGIACGLANGRGPESLAEFAASLGPAVSAIPLAEALQAEVIVLAIPFPALQAFAASAGDLSGKLVIDAMNAHADLGGRMSSELVAEAFPGAVVVKAFNQLSAAILARDPAEGGGRRVVFVASNDATASATVAKLASDLGFAPVELGRLDEGGRLIQFVGGPLVLRDLIQLDSKNRSDR
jgi:8-hydroxy-5-deazaflavin:NADPH oxidoreductase